MKISHPCTSYINKELNSALTPQMARVNKSYPKSSFRRILQKKTDRAIANDNTDLLVYLIYLNYLQNVLEVDEDEPLRRIEENHEMLMRQARA